MNPSQAVNPNKALWEKGDFTEIAATMRESGEAFVKSLAITTPLKVLDLGCGDGTTAMPLALLGADVTGIDIARNLVEAGNKRAQKAGLKNLKFQEGDACNLEGVEDHSFDLTLSVFGAMFAPKPFDVAKEMVRVTKAGGRIVMGNWIPNDPTSFVSQVLKISTAFTPPPPEGFISPMLWGVDANIIERFGKAGVPAEKISMVKDTFYFESPDKSPAELIDHLGGHHVVEFAVSGGSDGVQGADKWKELPGVEGARNEDGLMSLNVREPHMTIPVLLNEVDRCGAQLEHLTTRQASLEDVFVRLTGRHLREE